LPEILQEVKKIDKQARDMKKDLLRICWYMRGMSYTDAVMLGHEERELIGELIKDNLETTKRTGLPFF